MKLSELAADAVIFLAAFVVSTATCTSTKLKALNCDLGNTAAAVQEVSSP